MILFQVNVAHNSKYVTTIVVLVNTFFNISSKTNIDFIIRYLFEYIKTKYFANQGILLKICIGSTRRKRFDTRTNW